MNNPAGDWGLCTAIAYMYGCEVYACRAVRGGGGGVPTHRDLHLYHFTLYCCPFATIGAKTICNSKLS